MTRPPGNSLDADQGERVIGVIGAAIAADGAIADELEALLARIHEEIAFNRAKGEAPYRLGMHDGLRFAEEAVADILRRHGREVASTDRPGAA
ncbi:MAG: hypothetical protein FJW96_15195 [Actinobacteria bacterium]|nr:hypothetical protein [Actinomycetota bacterium]